MTARRPLQPLSPLSYNIVTGTYIAKVSGSLDGLSAMEEWVQHDNHHDSDSVISGLTALESDTDEFGKLMIQSQRDQRRVNDALRGNVQAFRKARMHPRVGLTLENLERNNGVNNAALGSSGRRQFESPPSEGSNISDPVMRPPVQWGRKARSNTDWLKRNFAAEDQAGHQDQADNRTDAISPYAEEHTPRQTGAHRVSDADIPIPSVEDSPLSHKHSASNYGTPSSARRQNATLDSIHDWDMSFDLNEASIIASTPYVPRNRMLDDIREREIESLKEQEAATRRKAKARETPPVEERWPKPASQPSLLTSANRPSISEQTTRDMGSMGNKPRRRTNSSISSLHSLPVSGEGERIPNSPVVVYKSSESVGSVDRSILANAQSHSSRPDPRREDSHELLRRLARASSMSGTPSPGRTSTVRPRTAPAKQPGTSADKAPTITLVLNNQDKLGSQENAKDPMAGDTVATASENHKRGPQEVIKDSAAKGLTATVQENRKPDLKMKEPEDSRKESSGWQGSLAPDANSTPISIKQAPLTAKTPKVTGGWVDTFIETPAHQPTLPTPSISRSRSPSPKRSSPSKKCFENTQTSQAVEPPTAVPEATKPNLPGSALEAIVEEAKSMGRDQGSEDAYGDSTIDSLEEMIASAAEDTETRDRDDDTLQGLKLPSGTPKNEAERQRQKEIIHLHNMNARLRAARTSIRDASRGMKRVGNQVHHAESEETTKVTKGTRQACPCVVDGHQNLVKAVISQAWTGFKGLFYNGISRRRVGLTWLGLLLLLSLLWGLSELFLCDIYCQPLYATSMKGFGVDPDAPRMPYVTLTVLSRPFRPAMDLVHWIWTTVSHSSFKVEAARETATMAARQFTTRAYAQTQQTWEPEFSMDDDIPI
ncbi:hypothetical protein GQ43DRAFT_386723 [Delitschia confertaspora ATCC 74209]|uniref:Uncharacterized protein n=1 Tax=Delitschia confertaspora ATCC 74209 TaxID=1513339 RepID=A0A9P4JTP2_9PLEO|nr:hypothetical protein GQ43DRAFT_386723 [Delitschia confertaspora ATCC 74209]